MQKYPNSNSNDKCNSPNEASCYDDSDLVNEIYLGEVDSCETEKLMQSIAQSRMILGFFVLGTAIFSLMYFTDLATSDIFFWIFMTAMFWYKIDSRVSIGAALFLLIVIMFFTFIDSLHITKYYIQGSLEKMAVWVYFFLVIGVIKQIWEYHEENKKKKKQNKKHKRYFNFDFDKNASKLVVVLATALSMGSFLFFYLNDRWNLLYSDTYPHLNMARGLFDNITPGLAQLGGQWLPLLHVLMAPFTANNFLWHSGMAGWLVSGPCFILTVYLLFKLILLYTNDKKSAFIGALVYMLSINMLYLQTMAMMESLFNLTIVGSVYFISRWSLRFNVGHLILGGIFVSLATLTRYEGYGVLAMALLSVFIVVLLSKNHKKNIFGMLLFFAVVAFSGIIIWSGYLQIVFGDAFHWLHPLQELSSVASDQNVNKITQDAFLIAQEEGVKNDNPARLTKSIWSALLYVNGIPVTAIAMITMVLLVGYLLKNFRKLFKFRQFIPLLLISISPFLFLLIGVTTHKVNIFGPSVMSGGILNPWSNYAAENGMRYLLSLLPMVAIFVGIATVQSIKKQIVVGGIVILQSVLVFVGPLFLTYNFSVKWKQVYSYDIPSVKYVKENHRNELVLLSSLTHEEDIFKYNLPYKTFIHESSYHYWDKALLDPSKYVGWIVVNTDLSSDGAMGGSDILTRVFGKYPKRLKYFEKVYRDDKITIYKKITK